MSTVLAQETQNKDSDFCAFMWFPWGRGVLCVQREDHGELLPLLPN